jgi:branched-chain amino acid transport system ATP-binding protein
MALLQINDLIVLFGEIEALRGVSIGVEEGQVVTLLGANGAGKSTTLRTISGLIRPAAGEVLFDGKSIAGLGPEAIVRLGISTCRRDGGYSPGFR